MQADQSLVLHARDEHGDDVLRRDVHRILPIRVFNGLGQPRAGADPLGVPCRGLGIQVVHALEPGPPRHDSVPALHVLGREKLGV